MRPLYDLAFEDNKAHLLRHPQRDSLHECLRHILYHSVTAMQARHPKHSNLAKPPKEHLVAINATLTPSPNKDVLWNVSKMLDTYLPILRHLTETWNLDKYVKSIFDTFHGAHSSLTMHRACTSVRTKNTWPNTWRAKAQRMVCLHDRTPSFDMLSFSTLCIWSYTLCTQADSRYRYVVAICSRRQNIKAMPWRQSCTAQSPPAIWLKHITRPTSRPKTHNWFLCKPRTIACK
jgi:hypothetical protein